MTRLRGYLLAALADTGLPADALPYVLEALESGHEPYEVAAAAIALRRYDGPGEEVMPYLERARRNMTGADSIVSFEAYDARWPYTQPTTAVAEARTDDRRTRTTPITRSARLLPSASVPPADAACPRSSRRPRTRRPARTPADLRGLLLRQALADRVLLHALRQPLQMLAHHHENRTAASAARTARPCGQTPAGRDHLRPRLRPPQAPRQLRTRPQRQLRRRCPLLPHDLAIRIRPARRVLPTRRRLRPLDREPTPDRSSPPRRASQDHTLLHPAPMDTRGGSGGS